MDQERKQTTDLGFTVSDVVLIKQDTMFWSAFDSKNEIVKKAGTRCVVADISGKSGNAVGIIVEDYDPTSNIAWIALLGADEVECVWRVPR